MVLSQFQVVGRKRPTETDSTPKIYRMRIFSKTHVQAKSRFWYFLHQFANLKASTGEILAVHEIKEKNPRIVKNFGILIRYNSRSGTHNMYKEFRDTRLCGAVEQMYQDMAGRHRARFSTIHVVEAKEVPSGVKASKEYNPEKDGDVPPPAVQRNNIKQFLDSRIAFPLAHRIPRPSQKKYRTTFKANRPSTFFS
mmetsp:Transcript_18367/g.27139  ORF Transcript_18367/g.27139 Transcript_18367/m.27139 type:complete len:195 (-) Transcript_18367:31-615(-)